ncbi:MAG: hypothetical protein AAFV07_13800 [Bacteroidota bacterium]
MTLIIGFIAGFLVSGRLASQQFRKFKHRMNDKDSFVEFIMEEMLEASSTEKEQIRPILEAHFAEMDSINRHCRGAMRKRSRGLRENLSPYVSQERLDKMEHGMRMRWRKRRGPRPGPHGPPPGP